MFKSRLWGGLASWVAALGAVVAVVVAGGALAPGTAWAQATDAAGDAAAMARAQRAASNPMRVILEASKIKRRTPEGEAADSSANAPAADTAKKAVVRVVSPAPQQVLPNNRAAVVVAAVSPVVSTAVSTPVAVSAPTTTPTSTLQAPPAGAPLAPAGAQPVPSTGLAASAPQVLPLPLTSTSPSTSAPLPSEPVLSALISPGSLPPMPSTDALVVPALAQAPAKPRMLSMVSPEIPPRVRLQVGRLGEVLVDLNLRRDGTVAGVTVLPPASRQIQRYVVEALEKWRYEPLPEDTLHRVQLVFDDEP